MSKSRENTMMPKVKALVDVFNLDEVIFLRKLLGLTNAELWGYLGLSRQQGYNIEHGLTRCTLGNLIAVTTVLKALYSNAGMVYKEALRSYYKIKEDANDLGRVCEAETSND